MKQTSLQGIANKAAQDKTYRFGVVSPNRRNFRWALNISNLLMYLGNYLYIK